MDIIIHKETQHTRTAAHVQRCTIHIRGIHVFRSKFALTAVLLPGLWLVVSSTMIHVALGPRIPKLCPALVFVGPLGGCKGDAP